MSENNPSPSYGHLQRLQERAHNLARQGRESEGKLFSTMSSLEWELYRAIENGEEIIGIQDGFGDVIFSMKKEDTVFSDEYARRFITTHSDVTDIIRLIADTVKSIPLALDSMSAIEESLLSIIGEPVDERVYNCVIAALQHVDPVTAKVVAEGQETAVGSAPEPPTPSQRAKKSNMLNLTNGTREELIELMCELDYSDGCLIGPCENYQSHARAADIIIKKFTPPVQEDNDEHPSKGGATTDQNTLEESLISTLSEEMHPAKISLIKLHEGATKFTLNEEDESGKGHMYPFNPDYTICLNIDGETVHAVIEIQPPEAYPLSGYSRGRGAAIITHSLHLSTPLALVHEVDGEWLVISDIREPIQLSEYLDNNAWLVGNPAAQVTDRVPRKGKTPIEDTSGNTPKGNTNIEAAKNAVSNVLEIHLRPYEHNYIKVADNIADEIVSDLIAQNILLPLP